MEPSVCRSNVVSVAWTLFDTGPWAAPALPQLTELPARAEYAVIGAGITGLSCALALAQAGRHVVVLERAFGQGAACRSGGIVVGDTLVGPAPGFDGCEFALRDWALQHFVAGAVDWSGCVELAREARLLPEPIDWADEGRVRVNRIVSGGTLNPSALVERLAAQAVACGASLINDAQVIRLSNEENAVAVETATGRVIADRVLVAVDATAIDRDFDPWPVRFLTVAIEIERPGDDRLDAIGWRDRRPFYTNDLPLLWGRVVPGGGVLLGRELIDVETIGPGTIARAVAAARDRLLARARGLHAAFESVELKRAWAGPIARSDRGIPGLVDDPRVRGALWAGGYGGHGLAAAFRLGGLAAHRLLA
jgi:glycine/D-amino acid oxidase-like deaminating enzyme